MIDPRGTIKLNTDRIGPDGNQFRINSIYLVGLFRPEYGKCYRDKEHQRIPGEDAGKVRQSFLH